MSGSKDPDTLVAFLDRCPWWLPPLLLVALTRLIDLLFFVDLGHDQNALDVGQGFFLVEPTAADPGYTTVVQNWDGQWYRTIAETGYPSELPRAEDGTVTQNPWAFYPALPYLARLVMLSGVGFGAAASTISLLASTLALVLLYRLLARRGGRFVALISVTALSASPAAPVLQTTYTEGLSLLLIVLALQMLIERRYVWFCVVAVLLGFTRPITIALVPLVLAHALLRWRREGSLARPDLLRLSAAGGVAGLSFGIWPVIAGVTTGVANAYLETQQAWVLDDSGWQTWGAQLFGSLGASLASEVAIIALLVVGILLQPAARVWPAEIRMWALCYGGYLLLTARPTPSITRYALLMLVVWWPFPTLGQRWHRLGQFVLLCGVLFVGSLLQYAWLEHAFMLTDRRLSYP